LKTLTDRFKRTQSQRIELEPFGLGEERELQDWLDEDLADEAIFVSGDKVY